ncbi:RNA-directed DNA polymerase, eukaryota, reverse transcriptase zinc-binding domain protein, partial [Tanacetum coccineum]
MINDNPWVIMGDLNVIINPKDHSKCISYVNQDMAEFRDCINCIKMEDVCSSGLHYTWIKSLLNPNNKIMKKIDRVIGNEEFFKKHTRAHVVFLPYGISDHSPAILTCPQTLKAKKKSFRFANYVADKEEFQRVVKDKNLFDKVKKLKSSLDEIQTRMEDDPTNVTLREQGEDNVSYMEIKEAIFDINDNKAPGPDGFTAKFFKKAWDTVGNDVFKAVKEFFSKGKLLGELNATLITLVPKVSTPHKVSDFI